MSATEAQLKSPNTPKETKKKKKTSNGTPKNKKSTVKSATPPSTPEPTPATNPMFPSPEQGFLSAIDDGLAELVEQDVVVQWFSSMMSPTNVKLIAADPSNNSAAAGRLPDSVVASSDGGANSKSSLARVSQNERWTVWGKWSSGALLPTEPGGFSTANLKVSLPLQGVDPEALNGGPKEKLWAPPLGFDWSLNGGGAWELCGADEEHDEDGCQSTLKAPKMCLIFSCLAY